MITRISIDLMILDVLLLLGKPSLSQVRAVLTECVRPAFEKASPNERLSSTTGTKIKREINPEPMYHDDLDDAWKREQGLPDIILWTLMAIEVSTVALYFLYLIEAI
jgi:hypothetical protein